MFLERCSWWFCDNELPCLVSRVAAVGGGEGVRVLPHHYSSALSASARERPRLNVYCALAQRHTPAVLRISKQNLPRCERRLIQGFVKNAKNSKSLELGTV